MPWRNWRVIIVLLLSNYLVFSLLATFVFPPSPVAAPTHAAQPTYTRSVIELRNVGTLTYDFLTPTATSTFVSTPTIAPTSTPTVRVTTAATRSMSRESRTATPALTVVIIKPGD